MRGRTFSLLNFVGLLAIGIYYLVLFYWPADPTNPSAEYYVNDYAQAFSSASTDYFLSKSEEVFSRTSGSDLGGLQIVNATYAYPEGASTTYDKTELFRKWAIGENDMGLLILYSYRLEGSGRLTLFKNEVEVGYRLSGYLTAGALGSIMDNSFASISDYGDLYRIEQAQAKVYALILGHVLPDAYGIPVTPFQEDAYQDYLIHYDGKAYPPSHPISTWDYVFAYSGAFFYGFGIPLILVGVLFLGDGALFLGRGGSSGGGGISRFFH